MHRDAHAALRADVNALKAIALRSRTDNDTLLELDRQSQENAESLLGIARESQNDTKLLLDLAHKSQEDTKLLTKLTFIATVFLPFTLLAVSKYMSSVIKPCWLNNLWGLEHFQLHPDSTANECSRNDSLSGTIANLDLYNYGASADSSAYSRHIF